MTIRARHLGLLALLLLVAGIGSLFWLAGHIHRQVKLEAPYVLELAPGSTLNSVLGQLQRDGLLGNQHQAWRRRLGVRLYDLGSGVSQRLHAGEYRIKPGETLLHLLSRLERGEVLQRSITIVEGWNLRELRAALNDAVGLRQTLAEVADDQLMVALGRPPGSAEGWFAADTWFYTRGDSDVDLLARALARQEALLEQAWRSRQAGLPYSDPYDVLIMASIIEKETGVADERAQIAGVFVERLRRGMRLQTDPTVIYGMGEQYQGRIGRQDLLTPTPWNTYVIAGLPPTPIAMPGAKSIAAAVAPADTDALYFVARGDGSHVFSRTLEEHNQAVRDYQLRRREDYRSSPAPVPAP